MMTSTFRLVWAFLGMMLLGLSMRSAYGQQPGPGLTGSSAEPASTSADQRLRGYEQRQRLLQNSLVRNVDLRAIGPTVMSGRVVDLAVNPADPTTFYAAYASGGLWKTTTNGVDFDPLFDAQASMTIGDIAVDWAHGETIWVGTGENNSSRSSYAGTGLYRSTDGGATWEHRGLAETHRTGRIVIHPDDPNTLWVAALGPLYSASEHRGVYKTSDGGATWTKTLYVDENTGAIDLVLDPTDPNVLYAATWHRERRAWNFIEGGEGSGIYKSTDGGTTWTRLTTARSGFPVGEGTGRIGLAVVPGNPNILYALLDNQNRRPPEEEDEEEGLVKEDFRDMTRDVLLTLDDEMLEAYLRDNNFPEEYSAERVKNMVEQDEILPAALAEYLEDANKQLFDTPVIGAEVYRSDDGGQTWRKTHDPYIDNLYYSYGYYFGEVRVDARDADKIYILGVPILTSDDGGQTFRSINQENVHVDHHALWVNPNRRGHLINGNDGGVNVSYDDGETWLKANTPMVGQFYTVQVDDAEPYNVYGGLQDNGVWAGPHTYQASYGWYAEGDYTYDRLLGGDGMQVEIDTRTNDVVYTGFQFGTYFRIDQTTGQRTRIQPQHKLGERPLRFNWQTPIHLSRHNQDILYFGANKLFRSMNRGDDWTAISDDLTQGGREGDVPYGTLTTIDESPFQFGLVYVGSDDGLIHVTRDGGVTWARVSDALPQDLWVSRVEASHHHEARVYATLNGYRYDNFEAYVYRSDDYGQTWTRIGQDLPAEPVNVIVEDPADERLLYVGTDHGLYVSIDAGQGFMAMMGGLPHAPVHDLKVQARAKDLVVGTHGRSIYVADLEHVQQLPDLLDQPLHAFELEPVTHREGWGTRPAVWMDYTEPEVTLAYFAGEAGTVTVHVEAEDGTLLHERTDEAEHGLNYITYDLSADPDRVARYNRGKEDAAQLEAADNEVVYLKPGTYTVTYRQGEAAASMTLTVEIPPESDEAAQPDPMLEPGEEK